MLYILTDLVGLLLLALMGSDSWRVREWASQRFGGLCVGQAVVEYGLENTDLEIRRRVQRELRSGRVSILLTGDFASPSRSLFRQAQQNGLALSWEQLSSKNKLWRCRLQAISRDTP